MGGIGWLGGEGKVGEVLRVGGVRLVDRMRGVGVRDVWGWCVRYWYVGEGLGTRHPRVRGGG